MIEVSKAPGGGIRFILNDVGQDASAEQARRIADGILSMLDNPTANLAGVAETEPPLGENRRVNVWYH